MKTTRDYDKEPIIIKDYGDLFRELFPVLVIWLFFFYKDVKIIFSGKIFEIVSNGFFFAVKPFIIMPIITIITMIYFYFQIKKILKGNAFFKFSDHKIFYKYYDKSFGANRTFATKIININHIEKITFCVMSDFPFRYGRSVKIKPKISTFATFFHYIYYSLFYFFTILPYKLFRLLKNNEPLNLLNKNIVIVFKNENYFLISLYSKKDLDNLLLYFESKNININYKSTFIYQIQNICTRWQFPNKYEDWCEEF